MPGVFVTGTGTDVGKTVISSGIAYYLRRNGVDVGVMKPFATSNGRYSKKYASRDVAKLARAALSNDSNDEMNPYFYPVPASPYVASVICGKPAPNIGVAERRAKQLLRKHSFLVVEGIGGIMVPLSRKNTLAEFAAALGLPAIIVTNPFLGTLNQTLLTVMACRNFNIELAGIVVNKMPENPDEVTKAAPAAIMRFCGNSPVIVMNQSKDLSPESVATELERAGIERLVSIE